MRCPNPYYVHSKDEFGFTLHSYSVGCGKCYACLSGRRKQWLMRLLYETLDSCNSFFVTLTVDDDHLFKHTPVRKVFLQRLFKNIRHHLPAFTYYAIGEYGSSSNRSHYHVSFFFKESLSKQILADVIIKYWREGHIQILDLSPRLANYILHYHVNPKSVNGYPTFQLFSKGLGKSFIDTEEMKDYIMAGNNMITLYDGTSTVIPRYYRKKLGQVNDSNYIPARCSILEELSGKSFDQLTFKEIDLIMKSVSDLYQMKIARMQKKGNLNKK